MTERQCWMLLGMQEVLVGSDEEEAVGRTLSLFATTAGDEESTDALFEE